MLECVAGARKRHSKCSTRMDTAMTEEELKHRHAIRVHRNKKHKQRDRFKAKGWAFEILPIRYGAWRHMPGEKDWQFNRRKVPSETGYGVAYDKNPDSKKYRGE